MWAYLRNTWSIKRAQVRNIVAIKWKSVTDINMLAVMEHLRKQLL